MGFPGGTVVKNLPARAGDAKGFDLCVGKIPWSRKWQPNPVFLSGKFHGQRNLAGYSPWACKEWTWLNRHTDFCIYTDLESEMKIELSGGKKNIQKFCSLNCFSELVSWLAIYIFFSLDIIWKWFENELLSMFLMISLSCKIIT